MGATRTPTPGQKVCRNAEDLQDGPQELGCFLERPVSLNRDLIRVEVNNLL
jgi:hypothetical protein